MLSTRHVGTDTCRLLEGLFQIERQLRNETLDGALDTLIELVEADRALVLSGSDVVHVACGRRAGRALRPNEAHDVCRSAIEDAQRANQCVVVAHDSSVAPESVLALGIRAAIAAPVGATNELLYVDLRHPLTRVDEAHRALVACAASLIGARSRPREPVALPSAAPTRPLDLGAILAASGMRALTSEVEASLRLRSPILIVGESGTGKTLLATALAEASGRTPVVRAMLGASDDLNTIASELFGHERGAFSGAASRRVGLVEQADGGTLILDEVLNLPLHAQQVLLDLTQFGTYRPLGWQGREPRRADVRIIAATNGDLERAVAEGRFRQDLYYRLAGTVLRIPPLRERRADIPALALICLRRIDPTRRWTLSVCARRLLRSMDTSWPGNVRELEIVVARASARALAADASVTRLRAEHFGGAASSRREDEDERPRQLVSEEAPSEAWERLVRQRSSLERAERALLERAVRDCRGVLAHAARSLGMPRTTLLSRLARAGIDVPGRRESGPERVR